MINIWKAKGGKNMSIVYNLDVRCHEMLKYLLYQDGCTSITQLAEEMNISKRSVYYDIRKINEWMEAQHLSELVVERKKGIRIDDEQKAMIRAGLKMIPSELAYVFTPTERVKIIICSILQRNRNLFLDDFMDFCQVSRNTTISDVKEAGRIISEYQLQLIYENGKGYHIKGDLVRKRSIYFSYFSSIADFYKKGILPLDAPEKVQEFLDRLKDIENALDVQYVQGTLYTIAVFFSTIDNRTDVVEFSKKEKMEIMDTKEYEMVSRRFSDLKESEQLFDITFTGIKNAEYTGRFYGRRIWARITMAFQDTCKSFFTNCRSWILKGERVNRGTGSSFKDINVSISIWSTACESYVR